MTVIAHKGYSAKFSDNSIKAFNEAILEYTDGIELDINLDDKNKYIIWHDRINTEFINKHNIMKKDDEKIIYFNDFINYIKSDKFKTNVKNNVLFRGNKFKIILDLKLSKKELNNFIPNYFIEYYNIIKNIDNIVTIVQTGIPNGLNDFNIIKFRDKNKLRVSFLYHSFQNWYTYEWYKSYLFGINMSLVNNADEIMYDYTNLNIFNIIFIWIQLNILKLISTCDHINFFTVDNKYIALFLQFVFSCSIISNNSKLLK